MSRWVGVSGALLTASLLFTSCYILSCLHSSLPLHLPALESPYLSFPVKSMLILSSFPSSLLVQMILCLCLYEIFMHCLFAFTLLHLLLLLLHLTLFILLLLLLLFNLPLFLLLQFISFVFPHIKNTCRFSVSRCLVCCVYLFIFMSFLCHVPTTGFLPSFSSIFFFLSLGTLHEAIYISIVTTYSSIAGEFVVFILNSSSLPFLASFLPFFSLFSSPSSPPITFAYSYISNLFLPSSLVHK